MPFEPGPCGKFIVAGDTQLHYIDEGPRDAPVMVLIHGLVSSTSAWCNVRPHFRRKYRLIIPDLPGHGFSDKQDSFSMKLSAFAEVMDTFLQNLEIQRFTLVGQSMGGAVSILLTERRQSSMDKLVLVDPVCYPFRMPIQGRLATVPWIGRFIMRFLYRWPIFHSYVRGGVYLDDSKVDEAELRELYAAINTPVARRAIHRCMREMLDLEDVVSAIESIDLPTLILWGAQDKLIPVELGHQLKKAIKSSQLEIVDQCGHQMMTECPRDFIRHVDPFLLKPV